ncbi:MAG TPA: hypothetical protein VK327_12550 [Candidatus Paceibacterota bacterium]|nr:hypothetical protein [Candidatus Paceibacterota bacterium]
MKPPRYLLAGLMTVEHLHPMSESVAEPLPITGRLTPRQAIIAKIVVLTILSIALGVGQGKVSPGTYQSAEPAGCRMGFLHGFLMPAALPGLLMGQDLKIYAPNNTGRFYNIGYIVGINTCGTVFFGIGFWMPDRKRKAKMA